jgi:3-oxoacyl-[acyl-carrier-protein] synthase II
MTVVISGIGAATPLGNDYRTIADNLLAGQSGIRAVSAFPVADHLSGIAGVIDMPPWPAGLQTTHQNDFRRMALWCAVSALRDAGLWDERRDLRIGIILGTATERNWTWEMDFFHWGGQGVFEENAPAATVAHWLIETLGLTGPALTLSAACASGNFALALGKSYLELDWLDYCLAGGVDLALTPMILAGFGNLRALSRRNDQPAAASRPFDRDRDGFVLGEGGVLFLLENQATARRRGAHVYTEIAGHGAASDASHMVIPSSDPRPAARAVCRALAEAQVNPEEVDYINAHATGTPVGDAAEARVLHAAFGQRIGGIPVSSTKSMTGHLLTAAAAFEALACIVALEKQALPPTINLDHPDPQCDLCHVAREAQERRVRVTVSNSFGFGGSNTSLVLRKAS